MNRYINILRNIIKNNYENEFDYFIKNLLDTIFDIYYKDRNGFSYNIDNVFKKYNINMYNLLKEKYILTNSKKLIFKKHKYNKREYIMFLLKKNNFILNEDENEDYIINKILNHDIHSYTKFIKDFCDDRLKNHNKNSVMII